MQYLNICHDRDPACQASLVSLCDRDSLRTVSEDVMVPIDSISCDTSSYQALPKPGAGRVSALILQEQTRTKAGASGLQNLLVWANEFGPYQQISRECSSTLRCPLAAGKPV